MNTPLKHLTIVVESISPYTVTVYKLKSQICPSEKTFWSGQYAYLIALLLWISKSLSRLCLARCLLFKL